MNRVEASSERLQHHCKRRPAECSAEYQHCSEESRCSTCSVGAAENHDGNTDEGQCDSGGNSPADPVYSTPAADDRDERRRRSNDKCSVADSRARDALDEEKLIDPVAEHAECDEGQY